MRPRPARLSRRWSSADSDNAAAAGAVPQRVRAWRIRAAAFGPAAQAGLNWRYPRVPRHGSLGIPAPGRPAIAPPPTVTAWLGWARMPLRSKVTARARRRYSGLPRRAMVRLAIPFLPVHEMTPRTLRVGGAVLPPIGFGEAGEDCAEVQNSRDGALAATGSRLFPGPLMTRAARSVGVATAVSGGPRSSG